MMKTLAVLATAFVLAGPAVVAEPTLGTPRRDTANLVTETLSVEIPAGHAMRATVSAAGLTLDTIPLSSLTTDSHSEGAASCVSILGLTSGDGGWVQSGGLENLACGGPYQAHTAAISSVSFVLLGRGVQATADALDLLSFGYWFMLCSAPAVHDFSPLPDTGTCTSSGNPVGFRYWDALAGVNNPAAVFVVQYNSD